MSAPHAAVAAYVALGSNLGHPADHIERALHELDALPGTRLERASSVYRSAPVGYREQPDFLNAVARVESQLEPRPLLEELLAIERRHGRMREFPNAPRTLDLDLLLYGTRIVREAGLTVPHARMLERAFVLVPLVEIAPDVEIPGYGPARDALSKVDAASVARIEAGSRR